MFHHCRPRFSSNALLRPTSSALRALAALAVLLMATLALARAETPAGCAPMPARQQIDATWPRNLGQLKRQLVRYRCTRYDAEIAAALRGARAWIERRARRVAKAAIVLDIDETALSNWKVIHHNDFGYIIDGGCDFATRSACGQIAWELSADAEAIAPTLELFNLAKSRNIAVFFVSGRRENPEERAATESNLRNAGYDGWVGLYMRPPSSHETSVAFFKAASRRDIESNGYTIIANIGDQASDLANGHAERRFKLPNPFYFVP